MGSLKSAIEWKKASYSSAIGSNVVDTLQPLRYKANHFDSAFVSTTVYFLTPYIIKLFQLTPAPYTVLLYIPVALYYIVQWGYDMTILYSDWTFRLANHFDAYNIAFIIGKIGNALINGVSLY